MKMANKRIKRAFSALLVLTLIISQYAISGGLNAKADSLAIQTGENWIKANQQAEGYWGTNPYSGIIDTSEILNYFAKNGHAQDKVTKAETWLNAQDGKNLNYEAKMLPYIADNTKHESILSDLTSKQNDDGGWGVASSYKSDTLDTVVVLSALMRETSQNTSAEQKAAECLISQQNSDGGWSYISGDASNISLTSQILMNLYDYSKTNTSKALVTALSSSKKFLISNQQSDKTWGTDESAIDDTLYAYHALVKTSDGKSIAGVSDKIVELQKSNGSWSDNTYTTILALEALSEPAQNAPVINTVKLYKITNSSKTESDSFGQNESGEVDVDASFDSSAYSLSVSIESPDGSITQLNGSSNEYKFSIGTEYSGKYKIKACVKDASGNILTEQDKTFSVAGAESISDLTLYKIKDGSSAECYSFNKNDNIGIAFTAKYDSKNESITVSVQKPDGTEISVPGTDSYTWNAGTNDAGNYLIIVRVLDKSGQTIAKEEKAFTLLKAAQTAAINNIKLYRVVKGAKTETSAFEQNETVNISVDAAYDSKSETMNVSVKKPDDTVETCANNNGYSWDTKNNAAGVYTVIVEIEDSTGKIIASQEKVFNVSAAKADESVSGLKLYETQNGKSVECDKFKQNENVGISFSSTFNPDSDAATFNGHTYKLYELKDMTWEKAEAYCEKLGGHLATITSQPEQSFIESILQNGTKNSYWLGASRSENGWNWVTGEPFTYTNWESGQPDNCNGNENCLMIYKNIYPFSTSNLYTWNDLKEDCTCGDGSFFGADNFGFICEWDKTQTVSVIKPDGTIEQCTNSNGYSWNTGNNDAGKYTVIVQINDGSGNVVAHDEKVFTIEQSQSAKINSVKIVDSKQKEAASFGQNESVGAVIDATYDNTKESLAVSVKKPDGTVETITDANGYIWNTGSNQPGSYSIIVQIKDSSGKIIDESDKPFTIKNSFAVSGVNVISDSQSTFVGIAETINISVPVTYVTSSDKTVNVNVTVYDANGKSVSSTDKSLTCVNGQTQATAGAFQFTPDVTSPQMYTIKATVTDGKVQLGSAQTAFEVKLNKITSNIGITQSTDKTSLNAGSDSVTETLNITGTGTPSQTSRKPIDLMLCIDDSGSMESTDTPTRQERISYAETSAEHIINVLGKDDKGGIVEFAGSIWTQQSLTDDKQLLKDKIASTPGSPWNGTAIGGGIEQALSVLSSETDSTRQKVIVVISDGGESSWSSSSVINEAATAAKQGCKIYTLGLGQDADVNLMSQIAQTAGGTFTYCPTADQLDSLMQGIAGEIFDAAGSNAIVQTTIPKSDLSVDTSKINPVPTNMTANNDGSLSLQWNLGKVAIGQTRNITIPFSGTKLTGGTNIPLTTNTVLSYTDANNAAVNVKAADMSIPVKGTISGSIFKQSSGKVLVWTDNDADNALAVKTLSDMEIGYTLVKSQSEFSRELNTRSYALYLLMGNNLPLSYNDEKVLISEIQNGKGVLNDRNPNNDTFNSLNEYKVKYRGYNAACAYKVHFQADSLFGEMELNGSGQTWYFENLGGSQQAELWMPQAHTSAVMFSQYGKGKTAAFAFDLGAEDGSTEYILNKTIQYLAPDLKTGTLGSTAYTVKFKSDTSGEIKVKCTLPQGASMTSMSNNGDMATGIWTMNVQAGNTYALTFNAIGTGTLSVDFYSESGGAETKISSLTQTMGSCAAGSLKVQQLYKPKTLIWAGTDSESTYAQSVLDTMSNDGKIVRSEADFTSELTKGLYDELILLGASPSADTQQTLIQAVSGGKSLILACDGKSFTDEFMQMLRVKFKSTTAGNYSLNLPSDSIFDQYDNMSGNGTFYLFDNTGARSQGNLNSNSGGTFAAATNTYGSGKTAVFGFDPSGLSAQSTQVMAKVIDRLVPSALADANMRVRISFTAQSTGSYTILPDLPSGASIVSSTAGQPDANGWTVDAVAGTTYTIDAEISSPSEGKLTVYSSFKENNGNTNTETASVYLTK